MVVYAADHVQLSFSDVPGGSLGTQEAAGAESGFQPVLHPSVIFLRWGMCVCVWPPVHPGHRWCDLVGGARRPQLECPARALNGPFPSVTVPAKFYLAGPGSSFGNAGLSRCRCKRVAGCTS